MNSAMICAACGTYFPQTVPVPEICPICKDDRQYVPEGGQSWISSADLEKNHQVLVQPLLPGAGGQDENAVVLRQDTTTTLYSIKLEPQFAISNRAILVRSKSGNILWDCIPMLDLPTITSIKSMGGLKAIAISHPHYYSNMNDWAATFDCPIYIHDSDAQWVVNKGPHIHFWQGDANALFDDIRILHTGGHFPGSTVLSVPDLSPSGTVLCGDSLYVARSKKHTAVMHSYPNQILLARTDFAAFEKRMSAISFDSLIGAFDNQELLGNARTIYESSMQRYKAAYQL